jgi:hypothetical protein
VTSRLDTGRCPLRTTSTSHLDAEVESVLSADIQRGILWLKFYKILSFVLVELAVRLCTYQNIESNSSENIIISSNEMCSQLQNLLRHEHTKQKGSNAGMHNFLFI